MREFYNARGASSSEDGEFVGDLSSENNAGDDPRVTMFQRKRAATTPRAAAATPRATTQNPSSGGGGITREQAEVDMLLNESSLASSLSVEAPMSHPSSIKKKQWRAAVRAQENFQKPDDFGIVECIICKFGVVDSSDSNPAARMVQIYKEQIGAVSDPTLYRYLALYWNEHVATYVDAAGDNSDILEDEEPIPKINVSQVEFHFESCYRLRNVERVFFDQLDKLLKIQNRVYENGVFVRTVSEDEQRKNDLDGVQRPTPVLTADASGNIIDEYAGTIRSDPPDTTLAHESVASTPLFSQMTGMIRDELEFIKEMQADIDTVSDPTFKVKQERKINIRLTKVFKDIRKVQAMERSRNKKVDKRYLVHSKEAAIFRDYNRAVLYTVRGLKEWREVSSFMDRDHGPCAKRNTSHDLKRKRADAGVSGKAKKRAKENFESY